MKEKYSIAELMVSDHERIEKTFNDFKRHINKDNEMAKKFFNKFQNELKNHFLTEEKIMRLAFKDNSETKKKILPIASSLRLDHVEMLRIINEVNNSLNGTGKVETSNLYMILQKHKNIEDRLFYPELDERLNEKEKIFILENIKKS